MTLPYERYNSLVYSKQFLLDLLDPKKTPKVPKEVRRRAAACLRHYPYEHELELVSQKLPKYFGKPFIYE